MGEMSPPVDYSEVLKRSGSNFIIKKQLFSIHTPNGWSINKHLFVDSLEFKWFLFTSDQNFDLFT